MLGNMTCLKGSCNDFHPGAILAAVEVTKGRGKAKKPPRYEPDPLVRRETLELVRAYYKIEDANVRQRLSQLIKGLGG